MQTDFKLYKVDMKYIRNLHNIDDKVLSVSPQAGKDNRVFIGIVLFVAFTNIAYHFHRQRKNIRT
jgi:protein AbiQ